MQEIYLFLARSMQYPETDWFNEDYRQVLLLFLEELDWQSDITNLIAAEKQHVPADIHFHTPTEMPRVSLRRSLMARMKAEIKKMGNIGLLSLAGTLMVKGNNNGKK